ncbi:MAG: hemerythrin domain-containing protein [Planctomycetaceae bacterium]
MTETAMQRDLRRFAQEHSHLKSGITDLRSWIDEVSELGIPHFGEMGDRMKPLYAELCEHFAHEEVRGFLAEAIALLPHLSDDADDLRIEHSRLLTALDALICRLQESPPPFESWQRACQDLNEILDALNTHEHKEMEILEQAASTDTIPQN